MGNTSFTQGNVWQGYLSALLGLVIIIWHQNIMTYFMIIAGIIFLLLGVITLISFYNQRKKDPKLKFPISCIVYLILGLLFVIIPETLVNLVVVAMGILLIVAAVSQIYSLVKITKNGFSVSYLRYIIPALILIAGVIITLNPGKITGPIMIVFGVALLLFGGENLYNYYSLRQENKKKTQEDDDTKIDQIPQQ